MKITFKADDRSNEGGPYTNLIQFYVLNEKRGRECVILIDCNTTTDELERSFKAFIAAIRREEDDSR